MECYVPTMGKPTNKLKRRLAAVIEQQQDLLTAFGAALAAGDVVEQGRTQAQLRKLQAEMQRLNDDLQYTVTENEFMRPRARATGKTIREQVLDIIDELGVPLAPATISEFSQATTGFDFSASRFASLRRDEERAARRNVAARPAWLAPAISASRLNAIPRLLTSSAWELDRRIVGARSLRVNHLQITLAFLDQLDRLIAAGAHQAEAVEALVLRYARGIPGASQSGEAFDPERVRSVVQAELAAIQDADLEERRDAAARLRKYPEHQRLWGLPPVIEGGPQSGRANG